MPRRHDPKDFHFDIRPWANRFNDDDGERVEVFGIDWGCEIGCGRWELLIEDGKPHILTEHMDRGDDKEFSKALLMALLQEAVIDE